MLTLASVTSGLFFVFLAALNPWIMLTQRGDGPNGERWMRIHRTAGYLFIGIFAFTMYLMMLRLRGAPDEIAPRVLVHMVLALMLAPLLVAKILVARFQPPGASVLLPILGIAIFTLAFTLVAINVAAFALRNLKDNGIPLAGSAAYALVVAIAVAILALSRRGGIALPGADTLVGFASNPPDINSDPRSAN